MPYNHPPETYEQSLNFLVRIKLETIWDGGPKFKKIPGKSGYRVTQQRSENPGYYWSNYLDWTRR